MIENWKDPKKYKERKKLAIISLCQWLRSLCSLAGEIKDQGAGILSVVSQDFCSLSVNLGGGCAAWLLLCWSLFEPLYFYRYLVVGSLLRDFACSKFFSSVLVLFAVLKNVHIGVPVVAQWLTNPTRNHEVAGSVPALAQWVNDPALPWAVV